MISRFQIEEHDKTRLIFFTTLVFGILLRLWQITHQSLLFFDEGSYVLEAARLAHQEPSASMYYARPAYIVTMGMVRRLIQNPILACRLVSVFGFVISQASILLFLPKLLSEKISQVAMILLCVSPLDIYYSRLVLPDGLSAGLYVFSLFVFFTALNPATARTGSKKSTLLFGLSGLAFGYFITVGTYRVLPVFGATLLVLLGLTLYFKRFRWSSFFIFIFSLSPLPIILQKKLPFFARALESLLWRPSSGGQTVSAFHFEPIFLGLILLIFAPLFPVAVFSLVNEKILKKRGRELLNISYKNAVTICLVLVCMVPIILHSIYSRKALRVVSSVQPLFFVVVAVFLTESLKARKLLQRSLFGFTFAYNLLFSSKLVTQWGDQSIQDNFDKIGKYVGIVEYGGAPMVLAQSKTLDISKTTMTPSWGCSIDPKYCKPDVKIVSAGEFDSNRAQFEKEFARVEDLNFTTMPLLVFFSGIEGADAYPMGNALGYFTYQKIESTSVVLKRR